METPHLDKEIEFIENTHWKFAKNEVWQSKLVEYKAIKQALRIHDVVGQTEQLPILDRCGCEEPDEEPIKVCMNCNGYIE